MRNVTAPTLTPVLPDPARATGEAVVAAPGGGFMMLSMDSEGYDVARFLARHGVAAFVLKYRTDPVPAGHDGAHAAMLARIMAAVPGQPLSTPPDALAGARAALQLVRARAAEWRVDPARIGVVGFSAGAVLALDVGLAADPTDRPAFIAPIYPPLAARPVPRERRPCSWPSPWTILCSRSASRSA